MRREERKSIPTDLQEAGRQRADRFRKVLALQAPAELRFGQFWTTDLHGGRAGAVSPAVVVLDPASNRDEAERQGMVVAPISLAVGYAGPADLILGESESPPGYACMLEVWNEVALLPSQLGRYLGVLEQPLKRYLGLLYQAQLGIDVDISAVAAPVGPAILHADDPRVAFQEQEVTAYDPLRQPLLAQLWSDAAAPAVKVEIEKEKVVQASTAGDRAVIRKWPVLKAMLERGWIAAGDSASDLGRRAAEFLGISSLDTPPSVGVWVPFRRSQGKYPNDIALLGWLKRVELLARQQHLGRFDSSRLKAALPDLMKRAAGSHDSRDVPQMLLGLGVHFVYVPHLPSTYVDGATFMLDDRPVIALSIRRNRIDHFWMTLLHELGHVVLGHTDLHVDSITPPDENSEENMVSSGSDEEEREADRWALDHLVDFAAYERFRDKPRSSEISMVEIKAFAKQQGRTPGIVLGLLWKDGALDYRRHRQLMGEKVREDLASWCDVAAPAELVSTRVRN